MSRPRLSPDAAAVSPEEIARLTAHVGDRFDKAAQTGARTPGSLRVMVLRPLAQKLAKLDLTRAAKIDVIIAALGDFDAEWARELVASRDTIGRALDEVEAGETPRDRTPRRPRSGARSSQPKRRGEDASASASDKPVRTKAAPPASSADDGMVFHEDLWGAAQ